MNLFVTTGNVKLSFFRVYPILLLITERTVKMGNTSSTTGRPNPDTSRLLFVIWVLHRYWSVVVERRNSMARTRTTESRDKEDELIHDDLDSQFSACLCSFCQDDGFTDCSRYCALFDSSDPLIKKKTLLQRLVAMAV